MDRLELRREISSFFLRSTTSKSCKVPSSPGGQVLAPLDCETPRDHNARWDEWVIATIYSGPSADRLSLLQNSFLSSFPPAGETDLLEEASWREMCAWDQRGQARPPSVSERRRWNNLTPTWWGRYFTPHPIPTIHRNGMEKDEQMGHGTKNQRAKIIKQMLALNSLVPWERYVHPPLRVSSPSNWGQSPSIRLPLSYGSKTQSLFILKTWETIRGAYTSRSGAAVSGEIKNRSATKQDA